MWERTLLLIVYDEHGGIFDHVPPPTLVPDGAFAAVPPSHSPAFTFDRLGVRVPAVFVSPFIEPGTIVSRQFDHCSIVATVRKLFCLDKTPFNWREAQALTFDDLLTRDTARTDRVTPPPPAPTPREQLTEVKPSVRRPTDLTLAMARAMEYSMETLGTPPVMRASQIYSAQDAAEFFRHAAARFKMKGFHG